MRKTAFTLLGVLLLACCATAAFAEQFPPGPGDACPDSATIYQVQYGTANPGPTCYPAIGDTVYGVRGVIVGFDPWTSGFAIYIEDPSGDPWTGVDLFTGGTNWQPLFSPANCTGKAYCGGSTAGLAIGDEVSAWGTAIGEYGGGSEIFALDGAFGLDLTIRRISTGNPVPPTHVGTVAELQELPNNPNAEQWEGMLVRVNGPMRVARNSLTGGLPFRSFIAVDDNVCPDGSPGPCDSLLVEQNTLDAQRPDPPPVGLTVNMVQGIYEQRTNYEIQTRGSGDIDAPLPPTLNDAYHVNADTIRCVFDRDLDPTTAQDPNNYTILSILDVPTSATLVEPNVVHLAYSNPLSNGDVENVTANPGIKSSGGVASISPSSVEFVSGVLSIADVQAPDPDSLASASGCVDRSRFAGLGGETGQGALGTRLTMRGVCTAQFGSTLFMLEDAAGGPRSGVTVYAPASPFAVGEQYLYVGNIQEYYGETEAGGNVYLRDEGAVGVPAPVSIGIADCLDWACDASQSYLNPEDFESTLCKLTGVYSTEDRTAGQSFYVGGEPAPNFQGTFLVAPRSTSYTNFAAAIGHGVEVTGLMSYYSSIWRLNPRSDADIVDLGLTTTGVGDQALNRVTFSVFPSPSHNIHADFSLPHAANVELGVFDLLGRRVATLANGQMAAGKYSYAWSGDLAGGGRAKPGLYFYRLTVDGQVHTQRGIYLQ